MRPHFLCSFLEVSGLCLHHLIFPGSCVARSFFCFSPSAYMYFTCTKTLSCNHASDTVLRNFPARSLFPLSAVFALPFKGSTF